MQLRDLIRALPTVRVEGPLEREISGLAYDSRRVLPGMVFVAIPGHRTDGHDHIQSAVERGACAVICQRNGFLYPRVTQVRVPDCREALARAAAAFYERPSTRLKVIGVTGTNGKTTVAFLIKRILEAAGMPCGLISTICYEIGERVIPAQRTTPEALEIQQMLGQMIRSGCRVCVMEVSSHALDQKRVLEVEFDLGVFTNLTQDHLDYHGTMEDYFSAKKRLLCAQAWGSKAGGAVVNIDDAFGARLPSVAEARVRLTYGLKDKAALRASEIELSAEGTRMVIHTPRSRFPCRLPLIGRHNAYNALAAAGVASLLEVEAPVIQEALNTATPVPGRLEPVSLGQPFAVFVDYAHTDDALQNVLQALREITPGRLLLAFGCGGDRDPRKRLRMGQVARRLADFTIITSDNPRRESPGQIAAQVAAGFGAPPGDSYLIELDRQRAIEDLLREARPGDTVLLAGKGHETYQEFEDTVVPFDDRAHAREALETLGWVNPDRD
jgi:UDP-N-acetylmuramoyl-L-alanyl-D-glutamate--2,6-diaminopimelate ligase